MPGVLPCSSSHMQNDMLLLHMQILSCDTRQLYKADQCKSLSWRTDVQTFDKFVFFQPYFALN
jgi:hypothetical protein